MRLRGGERRVIDSFYYKERFNQNEQRTRLLDTPC